MATHCSREPGMFDDAQFINIAHLGSVHVMAEAKATTSSTGHRIDSWEVEALAVVRADRGPWTLKPGTHPYIETDVLAADVEPPDEDDD